MASTIHLHLTLPLAVLRRINAGSRRVAAWTRLTLFLGMFWLTAQAQDIHQIAQGVDAHYNQLRSLQADFTEIYRGDGAERTESGTLWLKKPRKMRWEYRSPREKLFVSDGKVVWFYLPTERQVRKTDFRKLDDLRSPIAFLLGKTKLENELRGLSKVSDQAPLRRAIPSGKVPSPSNRRRR